MISTNALPETLSFSQPSMNTNMTLYAWFTNTADTAKIYRAMGRIHYTTSAPVPVARATYSRSFFPGQPVVIDPEEIDNGSTGGSSGGQSIPIHALALNLVSGPESDATPDEPFVTVSELGTYEVELVVMNAAGNVATSAVCEVTVAAHGGEPFVWTGAFDNDWNNFLNWN